MEPFYLLNELLHEYNTRRLPSTVKIKLSQVYFYPERFPFIQTFRFEPEEMQMERAD